MALNEQKQGLSRVARKKKKKKEWKTAQSVKMERVHMRRSELVAMPNNIVKLKTWE